MSTVQYGPHIAFVPLRSLAILVFDGWFLYDRRFTLSISTSQQEKRKNGKGAMRTTNRLNNEK